MRQDMNDQRSLTEQLRSTMDLANRNGYYDAADLIEKILNKNELTPVSLSNVLGSARLTKCPDCGVEYELGQPHIAFCPAHTCDVCGSSYGYVVNQQDRSDTGKTRVCDECVIAGL